VKLKNNELNESRRTHTSIHMKKRNHLGDQRTVEDININAKEIGD
jgi:hypothetical protein